MHTSALRSTPSMALMVTSVVVDGVTPPPPVSSMLPPQPARARIATLMAARLPGDVDRPFMEFLATRWVRRNGASPKASPVDSHPTDAMDWTLARIFHTATTVRVVGLF